MTTAARRHGRPRRSSFALTVLVAALLGAGVTAGCTDTVVEEAPSTPSQQQQGGGEPRREGGGETHGNGTGGGGHHTAPPVRPTTPTTPTTPSGHYDPNKCPAGLVC